MRPAVSRCWRRTRTNPVPPRARLGADYRALPRLQTEDQRCRERPHRYRANELDGRRLHGSDGRTTLRRVTILRVGNDPPDGDGKRYATREDLTLGLTPGSPVNFRMRRHSGVDSQRIAKSAHRRFADYTLTGSPCSDSKMGWAIAWRTCYRSLGCLPRISLSIRRAGRCARWLCWRIGEARILDHRRVPAKCDSGASDGTQTRGLLPGTQAGLHSLNWLACALLNWGAHFWHNGGVGTAMATRRTSEPLISGRISIERAGVT
jgi:hypothetical protein